MNCNDFWKKYEDTGLTPDLELHLAGCKKCQREMQIETALDRSLNVLPRYEAPDRIWDNICVELPVNSVPDTSIGKKIRGLLRKIFSFKNSFFPKPLLAGASVAVIAIICVLYFSNRPLTPGQKLKLQAEAIEQIERTEQEYLSSIARLSELAEAKKANINPEIYDVYEEKLAVLDNYILECREAINENKYNPHARTYLAMAYKEKTETLKEIIEYTQQ
ncbi:hypothetical protein ACFL6H_06630 [Candidatus Latescibacterota bacterium]